MRLRKLLSTVFLFFSVQLSFAQIEALPNIAPELAQALAQAGTLTTATETISLAGSAAGGLPLGKPVFNFASFLQSISQFGQTMSSTATELAIGESTLASIVSQSTILGKAFSTSRALAPYIPYIGKFADLYEVCESIHTSGMSVYNLLANAVASGDITASEAFLLTNSFGSALDQTAKNLAFITKILTSDSMNVKDLFDYIDQFIKVTKWREEAMLGAANYVIQKSYEKTLRELRAEEEQMLLAGATNNSSKTSKKKRNLGRLGNVPDFSSSNRASRDGKPELSKEQQKWINEIKTEAGLTPKSPDALAKEAFTASFWDSFCNFLYAIYALIMMGYTTWTFIKEKGNPQNRDRWIKILEGFIFGIILIALFKNAIIPAILNNL